MRQARLGKKSPLRGEHAHRLVAHVLGTQQLTAKSRLLEVGQGDAQQQVDVAVPYDLAPAKVLVSPKSDTMRYKTRAEFNGLADGA